MAKVVGDDFVRLYDDDNVELALDDGTYVQVFYTAKFSKVEFLGVAYKVVESVDFSHVVMLDEYGNVINNDNISGYDCYKNVAFDIIFNRIDSHCYRTTYKAFSKDFYNDILTR